MIFGESDYYDTYDNSDILKDSEKVNFVEFQAMDPLPSFEPISLEDEDWLKMSIRRRLPGNSPDRSSSDGGVEVDGGEENRASSGGPATPSRGSDNQLLTSDKTLYMTPELPVDRYTDEGRKRLTFGLTSSSASSQSSLNASSDNHDPDSEPISNQNVAQRRKTRKTRAKIEVQQLSIINQTSLEIIELASRREEISTDLDEFNVIEEKRTRRSNLRYALLAMKAFSDLKASKLPISHAAFAFQASFISRIINPQSSSKSNIHLSHLLDPSFN